MGDQTEGGRRCTIRLEAPSETGLTTASPTLRTTCRPGNSQENHDPSCDLPGLRRSICVFPCSSLIRVVFSSIAVFIEMNVRGGRMPKLLRMPGTTALPEGLVRDFVELLFDYHQIARH